MALTAFAAADPTHVELVAMIAAIASAQITSGDVFYGSFSNALIGQWGGLDITVDPYTNSTKGKVRIVALQNVDVAIRHGQAFAFNNDGV